MLYFWEYDTVTERATSIYPLHITDIIRLVLLVMGMTTGNCCGNDVFRDRSVNYWGRNSYSNTVTSTKHNRWAMNDKHALPFVMKSQQTSDSASA